MAAAEGTSVISVLMYDCCEKFVLVGGLYENFWPWPVVEFDQAAWGPLKPPEYRVL